MKKKILFVALIFFNVTTVVKSQYCYTCDWDWTNTNDQNWKWLKSGGGEGTMYYFLGQSQINNISILDNISESGDYLKKNGWELLYKDFGCSPAGNSGVVFPYFMLYNKYTGILRVFTFLYNQEFHESANGGIVTLKFKNGSKITSVLTHTNNYSQATSVYHQSSINVKDIGTVFLDGNKDGEDTFVPGYWCVADFNMAFDHLTPTQIGNGVTAGDYELYFDFDEIKTSTIVLDGAFDFVTQTYSGNIDESDIGIAKDENGVPLTDANGNPIKEYLEGARKVTKNMPSESDLRKLFKDQKTEFTNENSITVGNTKFSNTFKFTMEDLSESDNEFTNFLLGVSKYTPVVGKYLDAAISVVDFFSGKASSTPQKVEIMPTISKGNINLSGSITSRGPLGNATLELPGTPHLQNAQTPYYDCPLGVIGLEEEPTIEMTRVDLAYKQFAENEQNGAYGCRSGQLSQEYKSIKIKDDLKISLNKSVNVNIIKLKASLVCIDDKSHWDNFAKDQGYYGKRASDCSYYYIDEWFVNPFFDYLNKGIFRVSGKNEYSTPFIDVENFKNTTIFCSKNAFVYLKIYAVLETTDAKDTPILFSASYSLTEPSSIPTYYCDDYENLNQYIFPFTQAQLSFIYNEELQSDAVTRISNTTLNTGSVQNLGILTVGSVNANPSTGNIQFNAYNQIVLSPGFKSKPTGSKTFKADIVNNSSIISTNYTPLSSIVTPYFEGHDCGCNLGSQKSAKVDNSDSFTELISDAEKAASEKYGPNVFPNPANDAINIEFSEMLEGEITIADLKGAVLYQSDIGILF